MNLSESCFSPGMILDDLSFVDQFQILQSFEQELAAVLGEDLHCSSSPENASPPSAPTTHLGGDDYRPSKHLKIHNDATPSFSDPNMCLLSPEQRQEPVTGNPSADPETAQPKKAKKSGGRGRPPSHTYDHIMAERKRREILSTQFLALSTIVPGLRKMDKTSVLGDTIKYLKQIQERVKTLEEESSKRTTESVVFVKKSQVLFVDDDEEMSSSGENGKSDKQPLPEIETRVCDNHILLRIYCDRQKGVVGKIFSEVEKLNLAVVNSSVARFGSLALDITIIVEMEKEFDLPVKHIAKSIRSAIQRAAQTS